MDLTNASNRAIAASNNYSLDNGTCLSSMPLFSRLRLPTLSIIFAVAYGLIFICGVIGNTLVVSIVARKRSLHTPTNFFIVNLAVADLFVIIFVLPITLLTTLFDGWEYGMIACKAVPYVQGVSISASINSITAIAFDRYFAICHSFSMRPLRQHIRPVLAIVWTVAMVIMAPWLYVYDVHMGEPEKKGCMPLLYCVQVWPSAQQEGQFYVTAIFVLCYCLPLATITVVYMSIVCHVWQSDGHLLVDAIQGRAIQQSRRQVLRMILVLSAFFALSWLPFHLVYMTMYFVPNGPHKDAAIIPILVEVQPFAQLLGASNSCVNPIVYSFVSRKWRTEFRRLCSISCAGGKQMNTPPDQTTRRLTARLTSNASDCLPRDEYVLRDLNGYGSLRLKICAGQTRDN